MTLRAALLTIALAAAPNFAPPAGVLNPEVTQANIAQTICLKGWTRTIRPPTRYTGSLKRRQMAERHLPLAQAQRKDRLELALNRAVCAGRMALGVAQQRIKDPAAWK